MPPAQVFGDGILFRVSNYVYWLLALTVMFALSNVLMIPLLFLTQDLSNLIFFAVAAVPLGPAITALLSCMARLLREKQLSPGADFVRAYRANLMETLRFWVPAVTLAAVIAADMAHLQQSDSSLDAAIFAALIGFSVVAALWLVNMFVITAHFSFRARDTARLAVYYLGRKPLQTLGSAATLFVLGAVVVFSFDAVAVLLSCLFAFLAVATAQGMLADIRIRFTAADATAEGAAAETSDSTLDARQGPARSTR